MPHFTWSATGEGRYVRQFASGGEYAHVKIRISPSPTGSGLVFNDEIIPGAIPKAFIPAVERGLREAARRGIEGGFLAGDMRIELVDGSYHDVDSSEMAFRIASMMAFRDAINNARPAPGTPGDDHLSPVTEPRRPRPTPHDSAVAVPEPSEPLDGDVNR